MTSPYEDEIWRELVAEHGEALAGGRPPAPPPRRRPPWRAMGGSALVIAIAVAAALVYSAVTAPTPAYAVSRKSDGSVAIVLRRLSGIHGLNARLRAMHVHTQAVELADGCPPSPAVLQSAVRGSLRVRWTQRGRTVVHPAVLARRMRIVLVRRSAEGLTLTTMTGRAGQPVPSCVGQVRVAVGPRLLPAGATWVRAPGGTPRVILLCGPRPAGGGTATNGRLASTATTTAPAGTATNGATTATATTPAGTTTTAPAPAGTATTAPAPAHPTFVVRCNPAAGGGGSATTGTSTAPQTTTSP